MTYLYLWLFLGLMAIGMPIVFVLLLAPGLTMVFEDRIIFINLLSSLLVTVVIAVRVVAALRDPFDQWVDEHRTLAVSAAVPACSARRWAMSTTSFNRCNSAIKNDTPSRRLSRTRMLVANS